MSSKKIVSIALTATTILWAMGIASLPLANAQTTADLQAQIAALLAQIQQLQTQLNAGSSTTTTSSSCYPFSSDLTVGSTGAAVTALQQILINGGYLTAVSAPTGYFGTLTQTAVGKWQAANGISPDAGYFGPISRAFYASSCVGTTTTTTTGTGTTTGTTTAPATGLSVSLASDNPAAGSLITTAQGQTGGGEARAPVLGVNFTAGNSGAVTITGVNFTKTGVLSDSSINGAYLIYQGQVIAQYNSISNGVISFSGLNWQIPAGQTEDVQLAINVAGGLSAGNTTGFSLPSASDITAFDTNNNAVTPVGNFPLNGNTFTVTAVSNPPLASLQITSSSIGTSVTAGTQGNIIGAYNFNVQNDPLYLNSIAFHVIGSANMTNLQNVKLLVNGTQVGATLTSVGSNDIAYFNLASDPATLQTGSNNVQIESDVTGSPNMYFTVEILNGYDVNAIDSQYNVPITVSVSGQDSQVGIAAGQTTTSQDSSTPTGNIAKGVSQVTLAKYDVYASGEPTKVEFLGFDLVFTGVNTASDTYISNIVKNVNITDDAGQQIGTTINTPPSSNTCDAGSGLITGFTTNSFSGESSALNNSNVTYVDCFGTSGSPINYVIPANTTRVLSLKADIQSTANFSTVTANLLQESDNLQGQISSAQGSSSGASGSALTLANSSLSATQNAALGSQSLSKGSTDQEIGSYALTAASAEGVNVNTVTIGVNSNGSFNPNNLQNLKLIVNGAQFGTTQPTVGAGNYTFSGSPFNVPEGSTVDVNVYADINSNASGSSSGGVTSLLNLSGSGAISNSSISLTSSVAGQNITVAGSSAVTVSANQGLNPSVGQLSMGTTGNTLAAFNFQETANIENIKVTQLNVVDLLTTSTLGQATNTANVLPSFNTLTLWNGATQVGSQANYVGTTTVAGQNAFLYQFQFGNSSNFVIPRNGTLSLTLKGNANAFTGGNTTDGSIHTFEIATSTNVGSVVNNTSTATVVALGQTSNQTAAVTISGAVGTQQTVLQNGLVFSAAQLGASSGRAKSIGDQLATLTFTPGNGGSLALNTTTVTFSGNAMSTSTATEQAFASSTYLLLNGTEYPETASNCSGTNQSCAVTWNFGSGVNGFQVNGSPVTFTLVANDSANTNVAGSNNSVSLYGSIATNASIQYTDGTNSNSTTVTGISLPASVITPLQIFNVQFQQNS